MKGLPERIQELRENLDLAQKELAAKLGVSRSTLASWEVGHRKPELSHVEALAKLGGVSVDWLLGRADDPQGVARSTPPGQNDEEIVVIFRGKAQKLSPKEIRTIKALLEQDDDEKKAKGQP